MAESELELEDLAEELAFNNYSSFFDTQELLEDLGYDIDDLSEEEIESILDNINEAEYYDWRIAECDDEEWDSFGDAYIYTVNKEENELMINEFIKQHPNFKIVINEPIWPNNYNDGFYICKLKKEAWLWKVFTITH